MVDRENSYKKIHSKKYIKNSFTAPDRDFYKTEKKTPRVRACYILLLKNENQAEGWNEYETEVTDENGFASVTGKVPLTFGMFHASASAEISGISAKSDDKVIEVSKK
ncbi:hypothetical protein F1737_01065 [Methanoplanus sp. FWC-SCC4]|uniref:Uncharacterized protein n=1 Tax=Methanochimaera problematica TaxID=2609417 RepID=A0AA97F9L6_9EURY|nr:hypothetical protein [Methanoplanus sp. FWC-SCC4]WOF15370.1 hypothetical protein F1737_01065 [Methanoplanus sp. FWC-SCC4]